MLHSVYIDQLKKYELFLNVQFLMPCRNYYPKNEVVNSGKYDSVDSLIVLEF